MVMATSNVLIESLLVTKPGLPDKPWRRKRNGGAQTCGPFAVTTLLIRTRSKGSRLAELAIFERGPTLHTQSQLQPPRRLVQKASKGV